MPSQRAIVSQQDAPVVIVAQRQSPRIAKGLFVFLVAGLAGVIIFAMGQSVWGAIWRGWLVTAILVGIVLVVL